ncbi:hypothetical protein PIB30_099101 [Stylosanthes scabra]|uniref:F-box domain-containing protein n=1 Tax=Stylosanthes scabra TaxID=79078 RepID=A0ABU6WWP1_9FABA|nr:hypothetical protein [Stylosanthes scabra]
MKAHSDAVVERCNLPELPDDIVDKILVRLPVKSLLQFKSVCKSWKTLISNPQFAMDNFRQLSSANHHLTSRLVYFNQNYYHSRFGFLPLQPLFKNPPTTARVVSFEMGYYISSLVIKGSCNGLVCLHHIHSSCFCLWNPCTGLGSHWLQIDPSSPLTYFGFGYDHVHDKYKFVTVHGPQALTRITTFGAHSWNFGPNFPYPAIGLSGKIGKFMSGTGTLNWMGKVGEKNWVILSFDLANETFRQVSLPPLDSSDNSCDPELQILRNCLSFSIDHRDIIFDVWMMKDYGVWTMISRVNLWRHIYRYPLTPLSISEHDALLLMIPDGRLVLCKSDVSFPSIDSSSAALPFETYSNVFLRSLRTYFVHRDSLVVPPQ